MTITDVYAKEQWLYNGCVWQGAVLTNLTVCTYNCCVWQGAVAITLTTMVVYNKKLSP